MGFFKKGAFDAAKESLAKRGNKSEFFGEGKYIASLDNIEIKTSENPKTLGKNFLWADLTILKVVEGTAHVEGDKVAMYFDQYLGDKVFEIMVGLFKGQVEPNEITEEMAEDLIDSDNHAFDGIPCHFSRIREHYENKKGEEKSYVPVGLTRPLTKAEVEENGLEIPDNVLDLLQ